MRLPRNGAGQLSRRTPHLLRASTITTSQNLPYRRFAPESPANRRNRLQQNPVNHSLVTVVILVIAVTVMVAVLMVWVLPNDHFMMPPRLPRIHVQVHACPQHNALWHPR